MNPTTYQFSTPHIRQLGYLSWLILLVFSIVFYKERAIFMDGAFQLEEIINQKTLKIYHYRLTNPLTQILALIGIYLKLPLKWVLIGYSINFILFFAGIYHLIVHYCKNDFLGWVQLFFYTLLVLDSFYFLTPEFYQGISLLCLWFAILLRFPLFERRWVLPVLAILLIPILFDHKLIAAFFLFMWVFFWLNTPILRKVNYYGLLIWMFILVNIHSAYFTDWYDGMKQANFWSNFNTYYPNFHILPANKIFLSKAIDLYYFYPIFLLSTIGIYVIAALKLRPEWKIRFPILKLLLVVAANLGYLLLLHIGDPNSSYRFYAEVNYIGLSLLITTPLLFDFFPKIKSTHWVGWTFAIIMIIRLSTIAGNHQFFENRHQWFMQQLEKGKALETNRLLLAEKNAPMDLVVMSWSSPQASLLLSALENPDSAKTLLIYNQEKQYEEHIDNDSCFLTSFKKMELEKINTDYFRLKKGTYRFINNN